MTNYRDLLPVVVETSGAQMPDGFDSWGIKTVLPDLTTTRNFRWASPGGVNISNDRLERGNGGAGPRVPGDGLCVATTWRGMASGGIPAMTLILVAYRSADVVGRDDLAGKLRIGAEVATVALIDGERLIREHGKGANLRRSDLRGMILQCADLRGADLRDADLRSAYLRDADLQCADLQCADLSGADLQGADLQGARLRGARLQGPCLRDANLKYADLRGTDRIPHDIDPADHDGPCPTTYAAAQSGHDSACYLRADLIAMLQRADAVYFLPGWRHSRGARHERHVCEAVGIPIWEGGES